MAVGTPLRLLIVDDHAVVREGVARALTANRNDSIVAHATSLAEAQSHLAAESFDVAIVDIHFGDNSGLELVLWFRENSLTLG